MTTGASDTIVDILFDRAARTPETVAYRFHESGPAAPVELTMGALGGAARAVGAALQARGLKGERVVLALPHAPDFLLAFYACLAAGALAVPVPMQRAGRRDPRFVSVLESARPALVIADAAAAPSLAEMIGAPVPAVATLDALKGEPAAFRREAIGPDDVAILQYTSGSTGDPKGVVVSHGNFIDNSAMIAGKLRIASDSRGVLWLPFYHDMGLVGAVLVPMYVGGTADLMSPQAFVQSPMAWLRRLSAVRATTAVAPNFALERCCDMATPEAIAELDLSSIVCLLTGSEPVNPNTLERFAQTFGPSGFRHDALMPAYGLAESTLLVTGNLRDGTGPTIRSFDARALAEKRVGPPAEGAPVQRLVGNGSPEGRVRIVDPETSRELGDGRIGEIWLTGRSIAKGYWNRPEQTAEAFGARLAGDEGAGPFYRTGDLGFLLDDELFVTGRLKDLIIVRGRNLYPQDIAEAATRGLPQIATGAAAAFAVDRGRGEEIVVVAEATRAGVSGLKDADEAVALVSAVRQRLAEGPEVTPTEICIVKPGRLPRTSSGKIQHSAARGEWQETGFGPHVVHRWSRPASALTGEGADAVAQGVVDRASLEAWLVARLAYHSGQEPHEIALDEPFASYGLDSVTAVELIAAINTLLLGQRTVQPVDLYDHPTIKRLLDHMFAEPARAGEEEGDLDSEAAALRALLDD